MGTIDIADREVVGGFLRGLADPGRLRVLAAIVEDARTLEELSAMLSLDIASAAHHLKKLERAGLVVASADTMIRYRADLTTLQQTAIRLSTPSRVRETASAADVDAETREVLSAFFDGPRLKSIPVPRRKKELVLMEILRRIPKQEEYREAELNRFIEPIFHDFCTVRREWVEEQYMVREAGIYRWTPRGLEIANAKLK